MSNDHILYIIVQPIIAVIAMAKTGLISSKKQPRPSSGMPPPMNCAKRFGEKIHVSIFMVPRSVVHSDISSTS